MAGRVVCFGELIYRLAAPGREMLLQSPRLDVSLGGAEANVAVSLCRLGGAARMVSVLPDSALGHAARDELRRHGVDTGGIVWTEQGRVALYFLAVGAMLRPSDITYDRENSAFALAPADLIDWDVELVGAAMLHVSGVTAATGANGAAAALAAVRAARARGVTVSFDCNYRAKMWERWSGDSAGMIRALMAEADIIFGDDRDFALALGRDFGGASSRLDAGLAAAFAAFPNLRAIACTQRAQVSVDDQSLGALLARRDGRVFAEPRALSGVIERIGGGDAFVAGLLHALLDGRDDQAAIEFALAAAALKHAVPGDFNLVGAREVESLVAGEGLHVRR